MLEQNQEVLNDTYQGLRATAMAQLRYSESLPREELGRYQLELLNRQLGTIYERSPFYRVRHFKWGLPSRLDSLGELARFPFTTKEDLRDQYPFGLCAVGLEQLIRYGESTGTTGRPTSAFISFWDWIRGNVWVEQALRPFFSCFDLAVIAIPYELTFASYDLDRALEQLGVTVVAAGTLNQICPFPRLVEMMLALRPTALVCTPSRALRLYDMLAERGCDPAALGLRTLLYVGETCSAAKLRRISELWQCQLISAYGSTETNSLALPCPRGRLHLSESRFLFEVIDPETGTRCPDGTLGELVLTSLQCEAMPLLRYRTGDLVQISPETCTCGSPRRVLHHHGRLTEGLEVAGRSIGKLALEEAILATPGTGCYYAAGVRGDALRILAECTGPLPAATCEDIAARVNATFGIAVSVAPLAREHAMRAMDRMLKPGSLELDDLEGTK